MREPNGASKGSGFVAFSAPDEAARAVSQDLSLYKLYTF